MFPLLLLSDSYKYSHWRIYPPKTQTIYSYLESRGGRFDKTVFFGLQYFLKKYLVGEVISAKDIEDTAAFCSAHFGNDSVFNAKGVRRLYEKHGGRLPVSIRALPEGLVAPTHTALLTVENTDPEFPWLTNFLETLLCQVWYPTTVATLSFQMKQVIGHFLERTGDPSLLPFKLHDFGFRGVSSVESAAIGGAAHLVNFMGSDTVAGVLLARDIYASPMPGFSIPATEHSTICSWGREHEVDAYRHLLHEFPGGLVACVSDSYNIYTACSDLWGKVLHDEVLARNGTLVVRPDSGYPPEVVVKVLDTLGQRFGSSRNAKGYRVLDPHVRLIQGDGVDLEMTQDVLAAVAAAGWSADNVSFGMGGALLQKLNRDTQKFAFKCSAVQIEGAWRDVYKDPITDHGKVSKRGRFAVLREGGRLVTKAIDAPGDNLLGEVFRDGRLLKEWTFQEVRDRAAAG